MVFSFYLLLSTSYLLFHLDSHTSRAPRQNIHRGFHAVRVEVFYFLLGELAELRFGDSTCLLSRILA